MVENKGLGTHSRARARTTHTHHKHHTHKHAHKHAHKHTHTCNEPRATLIKSPVAFAFPDAREKIPEDLSGVYEVSAAVGTVMDGVISGAKVVGEILAPAAECLGVVKAVLGIVGKIYEVRTACWPDQFFFF